MSAFQQQTNQYVQQIKSGANSILVAIRVRPLSQKQRKISHFQTIKILQGKLLSLVEPDNTSSVDVLRKNRSKQIQYAFDYVFDQQVSTKTIYEQNVAILMNGLLEGYNASVLAYGATSCGKTYTMVGENDNTPGLMAMAVLELLNRAQQVKKYQTIRLKASYIQIYNENIKDLLISQDKNLEIRQDPKQGITITGLTQVLVDNITQLKTVLKVGSKNRTKESTGCNEVSSRSHGIFQIHIEVKNKTQSTVDETIVSKLLMIDLAGSERASNTTNKGLRMVQGAKINQSLLVLGNCIQALSEASQKGLKNAFVPYRGSKLTRLLKDSLGGNCRTVMIAHVSPALNLIQQTYNTLVYAHRAKNIKNNPIRNTLIAQTHLSNYVHVINNLKKQNEELKYQIKQKQYMSLQKGYKNGSTTSPLPLLNSAIYNEEITKFEQVIRKQFEQQSSLAEKIYELQIKIQQLAFEIYELELSKANERIIKAKNEEATQLSKQKLSLQQQLELKQFDRGRVLKEINKNEIIGSIGQSFLNNIFKQKKVQTTLKALKLKQDVLKYEKKYMNLLMKNIKNSMKSRQQIIEKQKVLIKKNNIISRITYSQLNFKCSSNYGQNKPDQCHQKQVLVDKNMTQALKSTTQQNSPRSIKNKQNAQSKRAKAQIKTDKHIKNNLNIPLQTGSKVKTNLKRITSNRKMNDKQSLMNKKSQRYNKIDKRNNLSHQINRHKYQSLQSLKVSKDVNQATIVPPKKQKFHTEKSQSLLPIQNKYQVLTKNMTNKKLSKY